MSSELSIRAPSSRASKDSYITYIAIHLSVALLLFWGLRCVVAKLSINKKAQSISVRLCVITPLQLSRERAKAKRFVFLVSISVWFWDSLSSLGANFGETEKRRISVSAEIRAEKFLAAEIFFFGSNPKFGLNEKYFMQRDMTLNFRLRTKFFLHWSQRSF